MTTESAELTALTAEPAPITLVSGMEISVERLRTRGLMAFLKILTRGASEILDTLMFNQSDSQEEFTGKVMGALILAIPEAEDEVISFINKMVVPANLKTGNKLTKGDLIANDALERQLRDQLRDPELDDMLTILSQIVEVEAPHVMALGKRLSLLIQAQRTSELSKQGASSAKLSKD